MFQYCINNLASLEQNASPVHAIGAAKHVQLEQLTREPDFMMSESDRLFLLLTGVLCLLINSFYELKKLSAVAALLNRAEMMTMINKRRSRCRGLEEIVLFACVMMMMT